MNRAVFISLALICAVLLCSCGYSANQTIDNSSAENRAENTTTENIVPDQSKALTDDEIKAIYKKDNFIVDTMENCNKNTLVIYHEEPYPELKSFDYINRATGKREIVERRVFPKTYLARGIKELLIITTGNSFVNGFRDFPMVINNVFKDENEPGFMPHYERTCQNYYAAIDEEYTIGLQKLESIVDIRIDIDGISVCFGPQKGNEDVFYIAYCHIPETSISYDKQSNTQIITFHDTDISKDMKKLELTDGNYYIESTKLQKDTENTKLFIKLKSTAKFYTAESRRITMDKPYVVFSYQEEYSLPQ